MRDGARQRSRTWRNSRERKGEGIRTWKDLMLKFYFFPPVEGDMPPQNSNIGYFPE